MEWRVATILEPLATASSLTTVLPPLATAWVNWLRFRPSGSVADDSTSSGNELCVNSGLASFCAFSRVFTPEGRLCRSQAPWYCRSVASVPSCDKIPILSVVESAMTRLESCPTIGPELPSVIGSLLCPSSQPPATWSSPSATWHSSSAIWHSSSAIWHSSSAIWPLPSAFSPFRIPHSSQRVQRSHQLAVPDGLVAAVPLECRAAIQRRAVVPLGGLVCLDFLMLCQQFLEPADVLLDDRADEDHRRGLITGPGGLLARGQQVTLPGRTRSRVRSDSGCGDASIMCCAGRFDNSGRSVAGQGNRPHRESQSGRQR